MHAAVRLIAKETLCGDAQEHKAALSFSQIGLPSPSTEVLIALCVLFGGATLAGTADTIQRATKKKMSKK
jgi:hypothetical protein